MSDPTTPPSGRVAVTYYPLTFFNPPAGSSAAPVKPYPNEPAIDEATQIIYYAKYNTDGTYAWVSQIETLTNFMNALTNTGIMANAAAFVQNRKIYRFFFDSTLWTCNLDSTLLFDPTVSRYWAIREPKANANGQFNYLTGVTNTAGNVVANYVDFATIQQGGNTWAVAAVGSLVTLPVSGQSYVVEIYDASGMLTNSLVFQAISSKGVNVNLTPDNAIVDMLFVSNRQLSGSANTVYLYQNESFNSLDYRVFLQYADGSVQDITYQQFTGGKLQITGLSSISTANIGSGQTFVVTYYINAGVALVPAVGTGLSVSQLSVSKTISVNIAANSLYNTIDKVVVVPYISGSIVGGTAQAGIEIFGIFKSLSYQDISLIIQNKTLSNWAASPVSGFLGKTGAIGFDVPVGNGSTVNHFTSNIVIAQNGQGDLATFSINGVTAWSAKQKGTNGPLSGETLQITTTGITLATIVAGYSITDAQSVVHAPTHVRLRAVINPYSHLAPTSPYLYSDPVAIPTGSGTLDSLNIPLILANSTWVPIPNVPILLEFLEAQTVGSTTIYNITGATPVYVTAVGQ